MIVHIMIGVGIGWLLGFLVGTFLECKRQSANQKLRIWKKGE